MPQTLHIVFAGPPEQRVVVKPTPMVKLSAVLEEACQKVKPALDPSTYSLHFQKKAVDLTSPIRFTSLPNDCRLDLVKVETPAPKPVAETTATGALATQAAQSVQGEQPPAVAGPSDHASEQAAPTPAADVAGSPLLGAGVVLFTQEALENAAAAQSKPDGEPPDDFYELTPEDYFRLSAAQERKKKASNQFKTQALREEEERQRAASYGPVALRLHLPGGVIMQSTFSALDPLSKVKDLVLQAVKPELADSIYLYTTPPRQVLKDMTATLHQSQLVPAAHIHVGVKSDQGSDSTASILRADVANEVKHEVLPSQARPQGPGAKVDSGAAAAVSTSTAAKPSSGSATGKKPKWLKLGPS